MLQRGRISVTWSQRWRQFRQGVLPILTFSACVACTAWLWQRQGGTPASTGEVEVIRVDVMASADGILLPRPEGPFELFETVEAGQVIARLDDRLVQAQLEAAKREFVRLREELAAVAEEANLEETERVLDHRRESVRLAWEMQTRKLSLLDRMTAIETDKVELRRLNTRLEYLEPLLEKSAISEIEVIDTRAMRDTVEQRIKRAEDSLKETKEQLAKADTRLQAFPEHVAAEVDRLLSPIKAEIAVQESVVEQLKVQLELLEVRAPFRGTIAFVHQWPGQTLRAGTPIITLASDQGRYVVGYVRDDQRFRPEVGARVDIRTRHEKPLVYESKIDHVGSQVELVAQHQLRNPKFPEWGIPVRIAMPPTAQLRPGELVDIRFVRQSSLD